MSEVGSQCSGTFCCIFLLVACSGAIATSTAPPCTSDGIRRASSLKGSWVPHESPEYRGLYSPATGCPAWARDWDCQLDAEANRDDLPGVFHKVFRPHACGLRGWSAERFAQCVAQRRIIMLGDSLMRQQWMSLACMLNNATVGGEHHLWDQERIPVAMARNYTARGIAGDFVIPRQYIGHFELDTGARVFLRAFGRFNLSLWDDVMAEFQPLTDRDVIVFNFGAWYPRYNVHESGDPWRSWQEDMAELINQRLSHCAATSYYRSSTATHFGGVNGTMTFELDKCKALAESSHCPASPISEYWYEDWMKSFLRSCGPRCKSVQLLPVYDLTQARNDAHHGSFGRGHDSWVLDCRHYCTSVVDVWNVVLDNILC